MQKYDWQELLNNYGKSQTAVFFLISFSGVEAEIYPIEQMPKHLHFDFPQSKHDSFAEKNATNTVQLNFNPINRNDFDQAFDLVMHHLQRGDSYLTNLTFSTPIHTTATLEDIYGAAKAKYKILHDNWVCFSPETFVQIEKEHIHTFPMKGTITANTPNATEKLLKNHKETCEHNTIVDLLRNDLSRVAKNVQIKKFRYLERIQTAHRDLWQSSTHISGELPPDWKSHLGDIFAQLLPAGSISGAPKKKTCEVIAAAEKHTRGFYTGIAGYFDGTSLDSCVLIRFIEDVNGVKFYKSGGGITTMSDAETEFQEIQDKIYVPIY